MPDLEGLASRHMHAMINQAFDGTLHSAGSETYTHYGQPGYIKSLVLRQVAPGDRSLFRRTVDALSGKYDTNVVRISRTPRIAGDTYVDDLPEGTQWEPPARWPDIMVSVGYNYIREYAEGARRFAELYSSTAGSSVTLSGLNLHKISPGPLLYSPRPVD